VSNEAITDILRDVLKREGWPTYTEHPQDRGGPTKGGITIRTLRQWRQRPCTRKELQRLDEREALQILERRYVDANGIHRLTGTLQEQVIDNAVLSGPQLAVKDLQRAVDTTTDGIIGPVTLAAIERLGENKVERCVAVERALRLAAFVQKNPSQIVFIVGWLRRALSFVR
jgi:lysozyme family protein